MRRTFARIGLSPHTADLQGFVQVSCHPKLILERYEKLLPLAHPISKRIRFLAVLGAKIRLPQLAVEIGKRSICISEVGVQLDCASEKRHRGVVPLAPYEPFAV